MNEDNKRRGLRSQISELREGEEAKRSHNSVDSFDPMNIYDAMKEKMRLKSCRYVFVLAMQFFY